MSEQVTEQQPVNESPADPQTALLPDLTQEQMRAMYEQSQKALKDANELAKHTAMEVVNSNKNKYPFLIANKSEQSVYDKAKEWGCSFGEAADRIESVFKKNDMEKFNQLKPFLESQMSGQPKQVAPNPQMVAPKQDTPYIPTTDRSYQPTEQVQNVQNTMTTISNSKKGTTASYADVVKRGVGSQNLNDVFNGYDTTLPTDPYPGNKASYRRALPSHLESRELLDLMFQNIK